MLPHEDDDRELIRYIEGEDRKHRDDEERELARRHFPHLSASVAPRESDETPTFWED